MIDPQHRLPRVRLGGAGERGLRSGAYRGRIGVYAGAGSNSYLLANLMPEHGPAQRRGRRTWTSSSRNDKDFLATRVSYKLDLRGPSVTVQTACSTSLVAVHLACQSLLDPASATWPWPAGSSIDVRRKARATSTRRDGILSPDGHCRAFDAGAQGTVFGSGVGVVVLKRLDDALADGDHVHAVIQGSAINNDGALKVGYTAPSVDGQAEVIARCAQAWRGRRARHDQLRRSPRHRHRARRPDRGRGADPGVPRRRRTSRVLRHRLGQDEHRPPGRRRRRRRADQDGAGAQARRDAAEPALRGAEPEASTSRAARSTSTRALADWTREGAPPRRAGVSSFGIGGTNAHVVLEEAPAPAAVRPPRGPCSCCALGARRSARARARRRAISPRTWATHPELQPRRRRLHPAGRPAAFAHRRVVVGRDARGGRARRCGPGIRSACSPASPRPGRRRSPSCSRARARSTSAWAAGCTETEPPFRASVDRVLRRSCAPHARRRPARACSIPPEDGSAIAAARLDQTARHPAGAVRRRVRPGPAAG